MLAGNRESQHEYGQILRLPIEETARRLVDEFLPAFPFSRSYEKAIIEISIGGISEGVA